MAERNSFKKACLYKIWAKCKAILVENFFAQKFRPLKFEPLEDLSGPKQLSILISGFLHSLSNTQIVRP